MKVKGESEKVFLKLNIQKTKITATGSITSWQIDGETKEIVTDFIFLGSKITADGHWSHAIKRYLLLGRKAMTHLDSILKSRDIPLPTKVRLVKAICGFSSNHVWNRELDYKESWVPKKLMLLNCSVEEDSWECLGLQGVPTSQNPKGNQSWIFIGRTEVEAETPILDVKNWLFGKDHDAGKDWRRQSSPWEEKGTAEDEMVGWHHWLDGHEFEQAPGAGDGQGSLACCNPWDREELDTTEWLNWNIVC